MVSDAVEELKEELKKADGGSLHPATEEDLTEARQFGLPKVLIDFYRDYAPDAADGCVQLDQRIWSVRRAIEENSIYVPGDSLFPLGYVVFASNMFGDAYCIDTAHTNSPGEDSIVLFPHDVFEDNTSLEDTEKYRLPVATSLEDFLRQFARRTLILKPKYA